MTRPSRDFPRPPKTRVQWEESYPRDVLCAYCHHERAVTRDHVVPKSYKKLGKDIPDGLSGTVPACFACNIRKGNRRLIPASWADKLPLLEEAFPGTAWRVWNGSKQEPAYSEVWT